MERALYSCLILGLLMSVSTGCAGTQQSKSADKSVEGQPPEGEVPDELPEGPRVKTDGDIPAEAKGDDAASEGDSAAASSGAEAGEPSSADSEAAVVTESQRDNLLDKGPAYIYQVV